MIGTVQDLIRQHDDELMNHPDVQAAISELEGLIRRGYPDTLFHAGIGYDPLGIYLDAYIDVEDDDEVDELYIDRLVELQVEKRIPIHVMTFTPPFPQWVRDELSAETVAARASG